MKIDLTSIIKEVGKKLYIDITEDVKIDEEICLASPIHINATLLNTGKSILLNGKVDTKIKTDCARCLNDTTHSLNFEITEQYCKNVNNFKEITGEQDLSDEDYNFLIDEENSIDLYEILRQNILSRVPLKVLCRNNCSGIPTTESQGASIDPRLDKFRAIKQQYQNDTI